MSAAARSLAPQLEASVRAVKARRWNLILEEAAKDVHDAQAAVDRYRHVTAPTAEKQLQSAYRDYFMLAEQARKELGNV